MNDKDIQLAIVKELKEMNRRLDRLCRASILTIDKPEVKTENVESIVNNND